MLENQVICNFILTKNNEKIFFGHGINLSLFNLNLSEMPSAGSIFLSLLNNFDVIIKTLEDSKQVSDETIYNIPNYLEKNLSNIDKTISKLFSYELTNYICSLNTHISKLERDLHSTETLLQELISNNDDNYMIETLKFDQNNIFQELKKYQNKSENVKNYITELVNSLISYKTYMDLYYGIHEIQDFKKKNTSFFQSCFRITFNIPKHQLYQAFIENEKLVLTNDLMVSCFNELKKIKKNISGEEIHQSIFNKTQELNDNKEIFSLRDYEISSIKDLLCIYFNFFVENKITINKCKNCGKYFIPSNRTDEKYCDNPSPQKPEKTCKQYGAKKAYVNSITSNPIKDEHIRTSQFYRVRISRAKEKNNISYANKMQKLLDTYLKNYKKQFIKYEKQKLSKSEFIEWIISQKQ